MNDTYTKNVSKLLQLIEGGELGAFFEAKPSPEQIADVVQELFERGDESHINLTMQALQRGLITDLRANAGQMHKLTIAQIWESTAYAQVLRMAGWNCELDSDPEGKTFLARPSEN